VATLTGHTARKTTALAAAALTQAVTGVTTVREHLTFDQDDTIPASTQATNQYAATSTL
jgi:hypothetical protein